MRTRTYYSDVCPLEDPRVYHELYRRMPEHRRDKADSFLFPKDRRLCVGAWALLRKALEDLGEDPDRVLVGTGDNGKPFLKGSWVRFNLSHSEERVACSVSDSEVGCDVEAIGCAELGLAERFFHGSEYRAIAAMQGTEEMPRMFCRYWTLKESFMKATGLGMSLPLDSFRIDIGDRIRVEQDADGREYHFEEYDPEDGYRCAVCSDRDGFEPSLRRVRLQDLVRCRFFYRDTEIPEKIPREDEPMAAENERTRTRLERLFGTPPDNDILDEIVAYRDRRADRIVGIILMTVLLTNFIWIFIGEVRSREIGDAVDCVYISMLIMGIAATLCFAMGSRWWTRYVLIGSMMLNSFVIIGVADYTMMIMMILPVISCSIYFRSNMTKAAIIIGALLMLAGLILNDYLSPIMIGMYQGMTRIDRVINLIKSFYIVDLLIYLLICLPCYYTTKIGIDDIRKQSDMRKEHIGIEKEMSNARGIQQGLLITDFPCKPYCEVSSSMSAAKEVGGDFYDCFRVGDDRLAFIMADVSGKGLPAALFMATSLTLIRSNVQAGGDLDKAMEKANRELSANNSMKYFVTVWIGVLDLRTGDMTFVNAGHNPPFIRRDGRFEMLRSQPDFVFGRKKRTTYNRQHIKLNPGDGLFLYTDGVTEATRSDGSMFGVERLEKALASAGDRSPEEVLDKVKSDVADFVGETDQSDDMTMMQADFKHYYDILPDEGIRVRADNQGYVKVMERIKQRMTDAGCSPRTITEMETACSEIYANIDMYAYADREEKGDVLVTTDIVNGAVRVTFTDWGTPFNPLERKDPDPILSFKERRRGGLGIMLVKKICDDVSYVYEDNRNILKLEKEM